MTAVDTNSVTVQLAAESSIGTLPGSPTWYPLEINAGPSKWGAEITKVMRRPISTDRQRRPSATVDVDSGVEVEMDLTRENFFNGLFEGAMFASRTGPRRYVVTGVTTTGYTVAANGDLPQNTLIFARGFTNDANNGLKVVGASSTTTEIKTSGLTTEAAIPAAQNATVEVAGRQFASDDAQIDSNGDFTSAAVDLTTLSLAVGQVVHVGDATSGAAFAFATSPSGYGRIRVIAAGKLTLDKNNFVADPGTSKTIRLLFGQFLRNYATDHASYLRQYFRLEGAFPDLDGGTDAYSYPQGNLIDTLTISVPVTSKATMTVGFVGTDTPVPTTSRATNASAPITVVQDEPYNTSADVGRLRVIDAAEAVVVATMKNMTLTIKNNVSPEKVVGTLGAYRMNVGFFDVDIESTWIFDEPDSWSAIRANTQLSFDFALENADGGFYMDFPSCRLGNGKPNMPINETVTTDISIAAERHGTLGYTVSFSLFPYLP